MIPHETLDRINNADALLTPEERYMLFSLVYAYKPKSCLEIGTFKGGSADIICAALQADNNPAKLLCLDFVWHIPIATRDRLQPNMHYIEGNSAEMLKSPYIVDYAPFDFVFVDGDHERPGIDYDIQNILPLLANEALILFHDAHYKPVKLAVKENLQSIPNFLISRKVTLDNYDPNKTWGGLQLAFFTRK